MHQLIWRELLSLNYGIINYKGTTVMFVQLKVCFVFIKSITPSAPRRGVGHMSVLAVIYTSKLSTSY